MSSLNELRTKAKPHMTHRFVLLFFIHRHEDVRLLVPDHAPEIVHRLPQGMLGGDVTLLSFVVLIWNETNWVSSEFSGAV